MFDAGDIVPSCLHVSSGALPFRPRARPAAFSIPLPRPAARTLAAGHSTAPSLAAPPLWLSTRWYLRRAPDGYLHERAAWSRLGSGVTETADAARTVDALRRADQRWERTDQDLTASFAAERYTLWLRSVWFPVMGAAFAAPLAGPQETR